MIPFQIILKIIEKNLRIGFYKKGEVAEWLKAHAWKACKGETLSWVRIPFSPPFLKFLIMILLRN